jgi:hypothetical protein
VAAGGELHAEFGSDDAGAAVRGVASDADAHKGGLRVSVALMGAVKIQQFQLFRPGADKTRKPRV